MASSRQMELAREAGKRIHHFHGGLRLRHHKKVSCLDPVKRPPLPEVLVVPLLQHAGDIAETLVRVGDTVLKGQPIGQCEPCATIHSPVSGMVEAIEDRRPEEGPVIFKSVGHAMFDLAAARLAFSGGGP